MKRVQSHPFLEKRHLNAVNTARISRTCICSAGPTSQFFRCALMQTRKLSPRVTSWPTRGKGRETFIAAFAPPNFQELFHLQLCVELHLFNAASSNSSALGGSLSLAALRKAQRDHGWRSESDLTSTPRSLPSVTRRRSQRGEKSKVVFLFEHGVSTSTFVICWRRDGPPKVKLK